ncbi:winged helix-turn-helix transcriptional regulator [Nocardia salmonicida]
MSIERDQSQQTEVCGNPLVSAFRLLGKRWNGVLLGTLVAGPMSFSDLRRSVTGISDSVLSERLAELAAAGLVQRSVNEGPPVAVTYKLTEAGQALHPALRELVTWATEYLPG